MGFCLSLPLPSPYSQNAIIPGAQLWHMKMPQELGRAAAQLCSSASLLPQASPTPLPQALSMAFTALRHF